MSVDRRRFLVGSVGASILASLPAELLALQPAPPPTPTWEAGQVRHLLPAVSDRGLLLKASFAVPLDGAPRLRIGQTRVDGRMTDTRGEFWQFRAEGLEPGRRYTLALESAKGRPLCEPWPLSTFPALTAPVEHARILFFTCAGGHEGLGYLPTAVRNRLLRRALSFAPHVAVANGDHVYWDLLSPQGRGRGGSSPRARELAGTFSRSALVFGHDNETVLKRAVGPQIVPVYGTDFRSTPTFFLQDDHDHFDNDEATDEIVTFPPSPFMIRLARATQRLYYPEFLPDGTRPAGLPWSGSDDRDPGLSESFGTLRYGGLVEVNLYDVRRTMTLAGPSAVLVDLEVERWLEQRAAASDTRHLVHAPSNPPGWSAGKWGEWYPDVLGKDGRLTTAIPKPYWQQGWLAQHDRLFSSLSSNPRRIPLVVSGDLHAIGLGRISRLGQHDFTANPISTVLSGPIGTGDAGWPSAFRGIGATPPAHVDIQEQIAPSEQHGFTIADFHPDRVELRFFRWSVKTQAPEAIDTLEPFQAVTLERPR